MTRAKQVALFIDPDELVWTALEKWKNCDCCSVEEKAAVEKIVREAMPLKQGDVQRMIAAWRSSYLKACNVEPPRLTANEVHALKEAAKRVGGADKLCALMPAFWRWRERLNAAGALAPQPSTIGFVKHLASVQELAGKSAPRRNCSPVRDVERARAAAEANPVPIEDVKSFTRQLAGKKTLTMGSRDPEQRRQEQEAQAAARRRELDAQAEELRRRELAPTERIRRPR